VAEPIAYPLLLRVCAEPPHLCQVRAPPPTLL
jgi:hypothetical protein